MFFQRKHKKKFLTFLFLITLFTLFPTLHYYHQKSNQRTVALRIQQKKREIKSNDEGWVVQVGAFLDYPHAKKLEFLLREKGYGTHIYSQENKTRKKIYLVEAGPDLNYTLTQWLRDQLYYSSLHLHGFIKRAESNAGVANGT